MGAALLLVAFGCDSGSAVGAARPAVPAPSPAEAVEAVEGDDVGRRDDLVCEAVATVLYLLVERIMVAAEGSAAQREAVEEAYIDARRSAPSDLDVALTEVEEVYDRIGAEYLALVADLRRGSPYDRLEVLEVFESRRPELREIFDRTGLGAACDRLGGRAGPGRDVEMAPG